MGDARETEKAPDAFRTISEVADELELPQHVLRFWESRFTQIKPVKRAGGRRFYRPEDVDLLRGIRHLLYTDGFTIKGAQRVLKDQGVRYVQDLGIEREVASMRSARPARAASGEGVTFGGLLGLLPRRRGKGREDDVLPDLPESAELPLPFPDAEADRDLASEPDAPPRPLRQDRARAGGERRDPAFDSPPRHPGRDAGPDDRRPGAPDSRSLVAGRREPSFGAPDDGDQLPLRRPAAQQGRGPDRANDRHDRRDPRPEPSVDARADLPRRREMDADDGRDRSRERIEHRRALPEDGTEERMEPHLRSMQRPSRGPASRLAVQGDDHAPRSAELDDPLLPFLDDFSPAPQVSEPIEDRIRRLKAQDRRPPRPHELPEHESRRPAQYPESVHAQRAGSPHYGPEEDPGSSDTAIPYQSDRTVGERRDWLEAELPQPRERDTRGGRLLRDGEWQQTDWVESAAVGPQSRETAWPDRETEIISAQAVGRDTNWHGEEWPHEDRRDGGGRHETPEAADEWPDAAPLPSPYRQPLKAAEPEYSMNDPNRSPDRQPFERPGERPRRPEARVEPRTEFRREPPVDVAPAYPQRSGAERPAPREAYPSDAYGPAEVRGRLPRSPASWPGEAMRRAIDEEWGEGAPQALPRATRVGPLIGPISEEDEDGVPMPEAEQRLLAERMASRGVAPQPGPSHTAPVSSARPQPERNWSAPVAPTEEIAAKSPAEPSQRLPREPLRPGPPEQYLPPHLRSEPRVVGQPPMAAPVLSRDDVHRMQSALYELGECRRLMEGLVGRRSEARSED